MGDLYRMLYERFVWEIVWEICVRGLYERLNSIFKKGDS